MSEDEKPALTVWSLAWPAVALNSLQTVNSLLDSYFVQHLPVANLTAIGAATSVLFMFVSLSMALGTAATALVSRFFGAGETANFVTANQKCLGLALLGGFVFAAVSIPGSFLLSFALLPDAAQDARPLMLQYLGLFALGLPAIFVVQTLAGSLRGIGDTRSPMVISGIQICLHIALNTVLINGPRTLPNGLLLPGAGMGLAGAATALTVSAWVAAGIYLVWAKRTPLGACLQCSWPGIEWTKRILKIAIPAAMMSLVRVTSLMAFTGVLAKVAGAQAAVGALRPAFSIESLAFMPAFGLSIAAAALVGQSLGMGRPDRAEKLAWTAAHNGAAVSLTASVLLFVFAKQIAHLVMPDQPEVAHFVEQFLKYICLTEVLFAYGMVFVGALQGAGDTVKPFWMTLASMWGLRVPLAGILALGFGLGADGCWIAMSLTQAVQGVLAIIMFRQGGWKLKTV